MVAFLLVGIIAILVMSQYLASSTQAQQAIATYENVNGTVTHVDYWTGSWFAGIGTSTHANVTILASDGHQFQVDASCTYYHAGMTVSLTKTNGYPGMFGYLNSTQWSYTLNTRPWGC
jgi:hypothetical protein